jgi:anti-sigma B factor antagonist
VTESTSSEANGGRVTIDVDVTDDAATLIVHGEIDLDTIDVLTGALADVRSSRQVLVDLAGVTYMDSAGLRSLMTAKADIELHGGRMRVTTASKIVDRLIEIAGVAALLYQNE